MNKDFNSSAMGRKIRKDSFEYSHDMEKVCEHLHELYVDKLLSTNQIPDVMSERYGINITSAKCYHILKRMGLLRGKSESISLSKSTLDYSVSYIDKCILSIVDGLIIGDGYVSPNHKTEVARLTLGSSEKEFVNFFHKKLAVYSPSEPKYYPPSETGKGGSGTWVSSTLFHPDLYWFYKRWYGHDGIKDVPSDIEITPEMVLFWYLGGGRLSSVNPDNSRSLYFATNSFSSERINEVLVKKLEDKGFLASRVTKDNRLFIKTKSIVPILKFMGGNSPVQCYSYKFDVEPWRLKRTMKEVALELSVDYSRLASWVKTGVVNYSRSPGGKKVLFNDSEFNELKRLVDGGRLSREKGKKSSGKIRSEKMISLYRERGEDDEVFLERLSSRLIEQGFPYKNYSDDKLGTEWRSLKKSQYIVPNEEIIAYRRNGLSFVDTFHPHIFSLNRKGKMSPLSLFNNKSMLKEALKRADCLSNSLTTAKVCSAVCSDSRSPRLNNFPPLIARDLYNYYCKDGFRVLDPCAGFGGRLMGASVSKRLISYTGIEPSDKTYHGLVRQKQFISSLKPEFESNIIHGCAEEQLAYFRDGHFDFCFTSPPYFDTEEYGYDNTQSSIRYNAYSLWLDGFLRPMVKEVYRLLKDEGLFVVNIGKHNNTPIVNDTMVIAKELGFFIEDTKFIAFPTYDFTKSDSDFRNEPVLVLKK